MDLKPIKPLFPFYGSKWRDAKRYPAPGGLVVEPFAGSAGYSLRHAPAQVHLYDIDPIIVGVWSYLIKATPRELLALPDVGVGDLVSDFSIPQEAKWLIGFWINRGSSSPRNRASTWQIKYVDSVNQQLVWSRRARERLASEVLKIRHWRIEERSYLDIPMRFDATYFVDPPYVDKGKKYRCNHVDHRHIGAWVQALPGRVIACENEGADWLPFRSLASIKSTRGVSHEVIYTRGCYGRINYAAFGL
jgi:hypothetical protein